MSKPADDLELDELAHEPQEARDDVLARARRGRGTRSVTSIGQAEARGALAERRDRREEPGRRGSTRRRDAPLAPVQVEQRRRAPPPRAAPAAPARTPPTSAPEHAAERRRGCRATECGMLAGCVTRQSSLPGKPQLPPPEPLRNSSQCGRKPWAPGRQRNSTLRDSEVEDLRERADEDRAEDEVPRREPPSAGPGPSPRRRAPRASSGVRRPSMTSPMHAVIGATNGMSVIVWCARKYQSGIVASTSAAEERRAPPERLRDALVEQVHRDDRQEDDRRAHRPLRVHHRLACRCR